MEIVEIKVYKFEELSDSAKDTARQWFREGFDYPWFQDAMDSVRGFCLSFGVKVKNYEIGLWGYSFIDTDAENHHFRGRKLSDYRYRFDPDQSGYYLDSVLWAKFMDHWQKTGDALGAFKEAIDIAVKDIVKDMQYLDSNEAVDEMLIVNEYDFDEDGRRFKH